MTAPAHSPTPEERYEQAKRTFALFESTDELAILGQSMVQGIGPMPDEVARAFRERLAALAAARGEAPK